MTDIKTLKDYMTSGGYALTPNSISKFTPLKTSRLSRQDIWGIMSNSTVLNHVYAIWRGSIGRSGMRAIIQSKSDARKEELEKRLYSVTYGRYEWDKLESEILPLLFAEGNAIIMYDTKEDVYKVYSHFDFNIYHDNVNKRNRYAYKIDGSEVEGLKNLRHGEDLWHIKDHAYSHLPLAPSRIDMSYSYIMLENEAVKSNINLFGNGGINVTLLAIKDEMGAQRLNTVALDENNKPTTKTKKETLLSKIWDRITGTRNANKVDIIENLDNVYELGKDNKSMQFVDLIDKVSPKKVAEVWGVTEVDMGTGGATTYNNVETMNYVLHDKVGRFYEGALSEFVNRYMLTMYLRVKIARYGSVYMEYVPPVDPRLGLERELNRNLFNDSVITLAELRDSLDLPSIDGTDVFKHEWVTSSLPVAEPQAPFSRAVDASFKSKTPTDKALSSELFLGGKKKQDF